MLANKYLRNSVHQKHCKRLWTTFSTTLLVQTHGWLNITNLSGIGPELYGTIAVFNLSHNPRILSARLIAMSASLDFTSFLLICYRSLVLYRVEKTLYTSKRLNN